MKTKSQKAYSQLESLPSGLASDALTPGCLVLEGGAFRGVYSEGVLDCLMKNDINLTATVGCSAGALNGMNYTSGQIGRSARINLGFRHDPEYVGLGRLLKEGSFVSFVFLFQGYERYEKIRYDRLMDGRRRFAVVAANCLSGEAEYPEKDTCSDIFRAIQASASMPFLSRMVDVDGTPCLDGGSSCKIPYRWALNEGYDKIVVVRTREKTYRKKPASRAAGALTRTVYRRYPAFAKSLIESGEDYNRQCEELEELERQGRLFVISPSRPVTVGRLEKDMEKLGDLYWLGYHDAQRLLPALREYLTGRKV